MSDFAESLKVLEVDFHFNEIVFKGSEMKESRSVLVRHKREVKIAVFLKVFPEVISRLKGSDLFESFIHL